MSFFNILAFILLHTVYEVKDLLCYNEWIVLIFLIRAAILTIFTLIYWGYYCSYVRLVIAPSLVSKITDRYCANAILSFFSCGLYLHLIKLLISILLVETY